MAIPLAYNLRNLVVRKTSTLMTALGIALTVAILLAVLALVNGLRTTLSTSGDPLHIIVLRKGSESELTSLFTRTQFQDLKFKQGIATGGDGQPLSVQVMMPTRRCRITWPSTIKVGRAARQTTVKPRVSQANRTSRPGEQPTRSNGGVLNAGGWSASSLRNNARPAIVRIQKSRPGSSHA